MADGQLSAAAPHHGRPWSARAATLAQVVAIYVAARLVSTGFFVLAAHLSTPASRFGADPAASDLMMGWDAQWYWLIAVAGYPSELPMNGDGVVQENAWAFMPLYPMLVRLLSGLLALPYPLVAVSVSIAFGCAAVLVLHAMLAGRLDPPARLWAVAFVSAGPLSALLQTGYAEAMFLCVLLAALWALQRRAWWWLYPLIVVMGYTRPGVLAFALLLGLYGLWRLRRRRVDPLPGSHIAHIAAAATLAGLVGLSWQWIVAAVTGTPGAYLATELAWRRAWTGSDAGFVPFEGLVQGVEIWAGIWRMPVWGLGVLLAALLIAFALVLWRERHVRMLGVETRLWAGSYVLYLSAVFFPQSSTFRLLLPLTPLAPALAAPRALWWRALVLVAGLALQWAWIFTMYARGAAFWQIP